MNKEGCPEKRIHRNQDNLQTGGSVYCNCILRVINNPEMTSEKVRKKVHKK